MNAKILALLAWTLAAAVFLLQPEGAIADHKDNGHSGFLYPIDNVDQYEMNSRTTAGLPVRIQYTGSDPNWSSALTTSINNWNAGLSSTAGFNVFAAGTGNMSLHIDNSQTCPNPNAHGCIKFWSPPTPSGEIRMRNDYISFQDHRVSDLMHEMGHVLYNANEHYPAYNCTSIMGHSARENSQAYCDQDLVLTTVQAHDVTDYKDAYGVKDAPNATYPQMWGASLIVHLFEGGYLGGNGKTVHQENYYEVQRSTNGVTGSYSTYGTIPRKPDNEDDAEPETHNFGSGQVPGVNQEWCFRIRGRAGGIASSQANYWGPFSKRYCVARSGSGSGVFVTSDRNGQAHFRVSNFSDADVTAVKLLTTGGTVICDFGTVRRNTTSGTCSASLSGPGYLNVYYNGSWVPLDTIGYDG